MSKKEDKELVDKFFWVFLPRKYRIIYTILGIIVSLFIGLAVCSLLYFFVNYVDGG